MFFSSWGALGPSWALLGALWGVLGTLLAALFCFFVCSWPLLAPTLRFLSIFHRFLERPGTPRPLKNLSFP